MLGLTVGAVGFALTGRARPRDGGDGATTSKAPAYAPQGKPMPGGCEVNPSNPPVLEFVDVPRNRLTLGAFRQGEKIERKVTIRNAGGGVLCVRDTETGCGCVKAEWDGDPHIAPKAAGTLSLRIDTTDKAGDQEKWVTLYTNDPKQRFGAVITVVLEVRLGIVVEASPGGLVSRVAFGTHPPGESATTSLRLKCPKDEPEWTILGVESGALPENRRLKFTFSLERVEPENPRFRCYDLHITHPGRLELGRDGQLLLVKTSHPDRPEIRIDSELTVAAK